MGSPNARDVQRFREFVHATFGIQHDDSKMDILSDVLRDRQQQTGIRSEAEYVDFLEHSLSEQARVAGRITIPETYFFRVPEQFTALFNTVLPQWERIANRRSVRILSCGCASGEEAYTIAMLFEENADRFRDWKIEIVGVDLNPAVLEAALRATYSPWSLRSTNEYFQAKYFEQKGRTYQLRADIRKRVIFRQHNVFASVFPGEFDVVFFRNVLIYFSPETARRAIGNLEAAMSQRSYLFLGPAETLRGLSESFEVLHTDGAFYYQRCADTAHDCSATTLAAQAKSALLGMTPAESTPLESEWYDDIQRSADRIQHLLQSRRITPIAQTVADAGRTPTPGRKAIEFTPVDPEDLTLSVVLHLNQGDLLAAERQCETLLERSSMDAVAHYLMAQCREQRGDVAGAIARDEIAIYLDPTFAMPQLHKGMLSCRSGRLDIGRASLRQSLDLLRTEDSTRILLLGGGFHRQSLIAMCERELARCGGARR